MSVFTQNIKMSVPSRTCPIVRPKDIVTDKRHCDRADLPFWARRREGEPTPIFVPSPVLTRSRLAGNNRLVTRNGAEKETTEVSPAALLNLKRRYSGYFDLRECKWAIAERRERSEGFILADVSSDEEFEMI